MQTEKLNLIPGSVLPVVNVSQYDKGRHFALQIYEGATAYDLTGKDVQIRGTKPDGNGFAYDSTDGAISVSGSTVTVSTLQQMTACGGQTMCELRITESGVILGTLNFILMVEPSALSDDTPISDTDIPAIERDFEAALAEAEADALEAEGWARGTQDGVPAQSGEPYYEDNAKYYKEQAEAAASGGGADALKAEGYAVGTQNGVPVGSGSPYYQNNAKYYEGEAATSASNASTSETNAGTSETNAGLSATAAGNSANAAAASALVSEGWSNGEQNGVPVSSGSPYYQDNAKYWKDQAAQYAAGGLVFQGSVAFASIPTTGLTNGDMYNITDAFTTDSRFIEGAGISVAAGTNIAWIDSVSKWDLLSPGGGTGSLSGLTDVTITSVATGQVLAYDGSKWVNTGLTIPSTLSALSDVTLTTPSSDQLLKYDGSKWVNGQDALSKLSDVTLSTPSSGQFLKYDGSKWVNDNGGGGASALDDLTDVDITTPTDGQVLTYDSVNQKWVNADGGGSTPKVYGAVWDGSADPSWTRTDDAAFFVDPTPYYSGMSGTPVSPFDNIQPWAGMVRSTDANAGEVVAIPKFYYKMEYASGTTGLKIQIAPASNGAQWASDNGYSVSPAHQDRGDGVGERDVVYVGRYHCASDYKSKTGVTPKVSATRATFRSGISALGSSVWQFDYASLVTIWMLYLVEFADWNSQAKIGGGCSATTATSSAVYAMGSTDSMPYHTGTVSSSIGAAVYGANQYRNIENLWGNCYDLCDGIYFSGANAYIILNPANFSDSSGGTLIGSRPTSSNYMSSVSISSVSGYEWALLPSGVSGSGTTYTCDYYAYLSGGAGLLIGGNYSQADIHGLFLFNTNFNINQGYNSSGSRLMVLP